MCHTQNVNRSLRDIYKELWQNIFMKNNLIKKVLIIAIPTYVVAFLTKAMVFTMPMLAITTVIATNLFDDAKENENRVDEGDGLDGGDIGNLDG
tara:strand:- start:195 stop:476 length:282 start_codon:yes stop_codon:yes gene_type:complete